MGWAFPGSSLVVLRIYEAKAAKSRTLRPVMTTRSLDWTLGRDLMPLQCIPRLRAAARGKISQTSDRRERTRALSCGSVTRRAPKARRDLLERRVLWAWPMYNMKVPGRIEPLSARPSHCSQPSPCRKRGGGAGAKGSGNC